MAYKRQECQQYIDDNPGARAECVLKRKLGLRCLHCPEHPDSPERAIEQARREEREVCLQAFREVVSGADFGSLLRMLERADWAIRARGEGK